MAGNPWDRYFLSCLMILEFAFAIATDPCQDDNHRILSDLAKRNPSFAQDSSPICDRYLIEGWYKAPHHEMVTTDPSIGYCGTFYPFWLNGTFPTVGSTELKQICQVGFSSKCQKSIYTDIKNCGNFNVYYLLPLPSCSMAYCFEKNQNCIDEVPAKLNVSYYNVVYSEDDYGPYIQYDPIVNLICRFTPLENQNLLYHIDWYVDSTTIISGQTVTYSSLTEALLSTARLSEQRIKIGRHIYCVVGAKINATDVPCKTSASPLFFAGLEILTKTLSIKRKGRGTVQMRLTIPFATETIYVKRSNEYLALSQDVTISFPNEISGKCTEGGSSNHCSLILDKITYDKRHMFADNSWSKTYEMEIQNTDNIAFNNYVKQIVLRMKTGGGGTNAADIFNHVTLQDIHINIVEDITTWKGKRCHSHADPHMRTFDGYAYECQHTGCVTGITSILFENKEQNQQVQVRHHKCYNPNARCICAIAVRSGKDVFMFDACNGRQYINFPICDDKSLKVVRVTDKSYKIFFPTGTHVSTTLNMGSDWFLQTEIYPSVADIGKTGGLCGFLDGDYRNDLTRRTGMIDNPDNFDYYNPPDIFSISWRARIEEDFFSHSMDFDSLESLEAKLKKFCSCNNGTTDCSYTSFIDCEGITKGNEYSCILHSSHNRRKRHAVYLKSFPADPVEIILENRIKRQVDYITENATTLCNTAFEASHAYKTCRDSVADFSNDSVQNCILDVSLTGDASMVSFHMESAMDQCKAFIGLNETLRVDQPEVAKEIINICQNNCSYHGHCENGSCICDEGFGGSDCFFDVTEPPKINEVLGGSLCDASKETCNVITFFGQFFVENVNSTCYIKINDISIQGRVEKTTAYEKRLEEQTLYEAICPNPQEKISNWINELSFNVSNDGNKFTRTFTVFIYNSECQMLYNESGTVNFTLATGFCFIDGECVMDSQTKISNSCLICDSKREHFDWSLNADCGLSTDSTLDITRDWDLSETTKLQSTSKQTSIPETTTTGKTEDKLDSTSTISISSSTSATTGTSLTNLTSILTFPSVQSTSTSILQTSASSNNTENPSYKEPLMITPIIIAVIVTVVVTLALIGILIIFKVSKNSGK